MIAREETQQNAKKPARVEKAQRNAGAKRMKRQKRRRMKTPVMVISLYVFT
jgi:hypothetical protein